jgi:hypothetical protein
MLYPLTRRKKRRLAMIIAAVLVGVVLYDIGMALAAL